MPSALPASIVPTRELICTMALLLLDLALNEYHADYRR